MDLKERNQSMREFFDRKSDGYDEVHSVFMNTKNQITSALNENTKKVLDLGAGTGLELIALFERFPDAQVTVIDISENMLRELAKRPFADRVTFLCGDFFELDFGSGYDAVISTSALHHFLEPDKKRLYEKVYACLADGGVFINSDKFAVDESEEYACLEDYRQNKDVRPHIDTPLAVDKEISILKKVGFPDVVTAECDAEHYVFMKASKN